MNKLTRVGTFVIPIARVQQSPEDVAAVMAMLEATVIRAEAMAAHMWIEYQAHSPMFEELSDGEMMPSYQLTIYPKEDGSPLRVEVTRED